MTYTKGKISIVMQAVLAIIFVSFFSMPLLASGKKDKSAVYDNLIQKGTEEQIRYRLTHDEKFIWHTTGTKKDNILLQALENDRDISIIKTILDAGIYSTDTNVDDQNAIMYACAYVDDEATITEVIKKGAFSKNAIIKRLNKKDANGKSAIDYAYTSGRPSAISAIKPYMTQEQIAYYESMRPITEGPAHIAAIEPIETPIQTETAPSPTETPVQTEIVPPPSKTPAHTEIVPPKTSAPPTVPAESTTKTTRLLPSSTRTYIYEGISDDEFWGTDTSSYKSGNLTYIENAGYSDEYGQTLLMHAVREGDIEKMANLIFSGADINAQDREGWTALMYSARYQGDSRAAEMLINSGADIYIRNNYGLTALAIAATYAQTSEVVETILSPYKTKDEDVTQAFIYSLTTPERKSPIQQTNIAQLFINKGVNINVFWRGKTPLMYAAQSAHSTDILAMLLRNGAKTNLLSSEGNTAFYYAQQNSFLPHDEIYWYLND